MYSKIENGRSWYTQFIRPGIEHIMQITTTADGLIDTDM